MLSDRYQALREFLKDYEPIWSRSILQNWPLSKSDYPLSWLEYIAQLTPSEQAEVQEETILLSMPLDLKEFMVKAATLAELPRRTENWTLDAIDSQGLNLKKQHEIERLLPLLAKVNTASTIEHAVDIGGGKAHLARLCIKNFQWQFDTIDRDAKLQSEGQWWLKRTRGVDQNRLRFILAAVSPKPHPTIDPIFSVPKTLSLGLHTCGPLALTQFRKSRHSEVILNFGCCFDKIVTGIESPNNDDLNLSKIAGKNPLPWTQHALFLATRSRKGMSEAEFILLQRVQSYRFTLHLICQNFFEEEGFVVAGDAPKSLYLQDFASYTFDRLQKLGKTIAWSRDEISDFFEAESTKREVALLLAAHQLRNVLARPLEVALLLDRAIWLEERNYAVEVFEVFDRAISPRNIAILARFTKARTC